MLATISGVQLARAQAGVRVAVGAQAVIICIEHGTTLFNPETTINYFVSLSNR